MLSTDDLRKQLTASEAYNRYMEKRVRMLELEVKMLQSAAVPFGASTETAQAHSGGGSGRFSGTTGGESSGAATGDSGAVPASPNRRPGGDIKDMTASQVLDELLRLRIEHKVTMSELKQSKKELSMATANLQHFTVKEQQQRQRATQLTEEVRQLRSLLPSHLFDGGPMNASEAIASSRGVSYLSTTDMSGSPPPGSRRGTSTTTVDSLETVNDTTAVTVGGGDGKIKGALAASNEAVSAVRQLVADAAANAEQLFALPQISYNASLTTTPPPPSTLPLDLAELTSQRERLERWRGVSTRVHTVLKFSKRDLVELDTSMHSLASPSSPPARHAAKKKYDKTQAQLEALLSLVDRNVDHLKELIVELPKGMAAYLTKCRSGIGIIVDGQRANTPSALAALKQQAAQLTAELRRHRDDFSMTLHQVRQQTAALCAVLMSCVDGAIGVNMYRNLQHGLKFIIALESQVPILLGFDHAVELDAVREQTIRSSSGAEEPWYVNGLSLEREIARLSELDPRTDRIEKLDITSIKRLFPDSLSAAASIAAGGGMNHTFAETVVTLETIKTTASQLYKLFRGELNTTTTASTALGDGSGCDGGELTAHKSVQCNLQQQKMQMTENELHIARLANIRSNWFEAAVSTAAAGSGSPTAGRDGSPFQDGGAGGGGHATNRGNMGGIGSSPPTPRTGRHLSMIGAAGSPKGAGGKASMADVERMLADTIGRLQLPVPDNFAPVKSRVQRYNSENEGFLFHYGRRVISLHVTGNAGHMAVHIGGGYITFEEFCFKYGPSEVAMMERRRGGGGSGDSPDAVASPSSVNVGSDEVVDAAGGRKASVPRLRTELRGQLSRSD